MMYRCLGCGNLFEEGEQKKVAERGEAWGAPFVVYHDVCPLCEGECEEVEPCCVCGGYGEREEGDCACAECKKRITTKFNRVFSKKERTLLIDLIDYGEL